MNKTHLSWLFVAIFALGANNAPAQDELQFNESGFSKCVVPCGRILEDPALFVWGCSPIDGPDGKVHVFFARWPAEEGFDGWKSGRSWAGHAVAEKPEGPYEVVQEDIGLNRWLAGQIGEAVWVHNPEVRRFGERYVIVFNWNRAASNIRTRRIGLAFADSLMGPWSVSPNIIAPGPQGAWDELTVLNPTLLQHPDGRFFIYYRTWDRRHDDLFGVAIADNVEGPYAKYEGNPVINPTRLVNGANAGLEDPFAFAEGANIHVLARDYGVFRGRDTPHDPGSGLFFSSKDGLEFPHTPEIAYHGTLHYYERSDIETGPRWERFERPKLLFRNGRPAYLFNALGGGKGGTATGHVFRIEENCRRESPPRGPAIRCQRRGERKVSGTFAGQFQSLFLYKSLLLSNLIR